MDALEPGLTATVEAVVTPADTARALGSGSVEVLGTPRLLALCEAATCAAVEGRLAGRTSVGVRVEVDHRRPTPVGGRVAATATLVGAEGRRLEFEVVASDDRGEIATGRVVRVIVPADFGR